MQLPLSAEVLVPVGVGAIVVVAACVALVIGRRRRGNDPAALTDADWTGERQVDADPPPWTAPSRTVADAIAARQADTDPFPPVPPAVVRSGAGGTGVAVAHRPEVASSTVAPQRTAVATGRFVDVEHLEPDVATADLPTGRSAPGLDWLAAAGATRPARRVAEPGPTPTRRDAAYRQTGETAAVRDDGTGAPRPTAVAPSPTRRATTSEQPGARPAVPGAAGPDSGRSAGAPRSTEPISSGSAGPAATTAADSGLGWPVTPAATDSVSVTGAASSAPRRPVTPAATDSASVIGAAKSGPGRPAAPITTDSTFATGGTNFGSGRPVTSAAVGSVPVTGASNSGLGRLAGPAAVDSASATSASSSGQGRPVTPAAGDSTAAGRPLSEAEASGSGSPATGGHPDPAAGDAAFRGSGRNSTTTGAAVPPGPESVRGSSGGNGDRYTGPSRLRVLGAADAGPVGRAVPSAAGSGPGSAAGTGGAHPAGASHLGSAGSAAPGDQRSVFSPGPTNVVRMERVGGGPTRSPRTWRGVEPARSSYSRPVPSDPAWAVDTTGLRAGDDRHPAHPAGPPPPQKPRGGTGSNLWFVPLIAEPHLSPPAQPPLDDPAAKRAHPAASAEPPSDADPTGTGPRPTAASPSDSGGSPVPVDGDASPASTSGSNRALAAAVAHALAARAAGPDADRRDDARDRLLAVLLDDPQQAVGAAVDLQRCQEGIGLLDHARRGERGTLSEVLGRLASAGLRTDQLARLSGLPVEAVAELLGRGVSG